MDPALCRGGLDEPHVFPGDGQTAIRVWDHGDAPARAVRAVAPAAEPRVRFCRADLGAAGDGSDHDGGVGEPSGADDPQGGKSFARIVTKGDKKRRFMHS